LRVDHAGLDDDALVGDVDFEEADEPREADDDAAFDGEGAAGEAGAGAAGDEGDRVVVAEADELLDLFRGRREDDRGGDDAKIGQPVALVGAQLLRSDDQPFVADDPAERLGERWVRGVPPRRA